MKAIKKILLFILVLTITGVGLYWAKMKGYLKNTPLDQITWQSLQNIGQDAGQQSQILADRAKESSKQVQQVLGESIQVNQEEDKPIHQKAFEYGRYLYCQQVVKDWEQQHQSVDNSSN